MSRRRTVAQALDLVAGAIAVGVVVATLVLVFGGLLVVMRP